MYLSVIDSFKNLVKIFSFRAEIESLLLLYLRPEFAEYKGYITQQLMLKVNFFPPLILWRLHVGVFNVCSQKQGYHFKCLPYQSQQGKFIISVVLWSCFEFSDKNKWIKNLKQIISSSLFSVMMSATLIFVTNPPDIII